MAFWSENFGDTTIKDPKRSFRFTVEFSSVNSKTGGSILWYAKSVTKPAYTIEEAEHNYLNHTFYYPGSVKWETITISLVDPVDPDIAATLSALVQESGYAPPADTNSLQTISKGGAAGALGNVVISQIDGLGTPIETWTLWNSWIKSVKYGDLEYGNDELTVLEMEVRYDWAKLETKKTEGSVSTGAAAGAQTFFAVSGE